MGSEWLENVKEPLIVRLSFKPIAYNEWSPMENWTIYHNPQCSKSREALALLQNKGVQPRVIEYLKEPLSEDQLKALISRLQGPVSALVRVKEELYQSLNFDLNSVDVIAENLAKHPRLLERPIVVKDGVALIARPVELIETLK